MRYRSMTAAGALAVLIGVGASVPLQVLATERQDRADAERGIVDGTATWPKPPARPLIRLVETIGGLETVKTAVRNAVLHFPRGEAEPVELLVRDDAVLSRRQGLKLKLPRAMSELPSIIVGKSLIARHWGSVAG